MCEGTLRYASGSCARDDLDHDDGSPSERRLGFDGSPVAFAARLIAQYVVGFVEHLYGLGALRADLTVERAAGMAALLMDPLGYRRLVLGDGWTVEEYAEWVARLAAASFLTES